MCVPGIVCEQFTGIITFAQPCQGILATRLFSLWEVQAWTGAEGSRLSSRSMRFASPSALVLLWCHYEFLLSWPLSSQLTEGSALVCLPPSCTTCTAPSRGTMENRRVSWSLILQSCSSPAVFLAKERRVGVSFTGCCMFNPPCKADSVTRQTIVLDCHVYQCELGLHFNL